MAVAKKKTDKTPAKKASANFRPTKAGVKKKKVAAGMIHGKTNAEIAAEIGTTDRQVRNLKNSPEVQDQVARFFTEHEADLKELETLSIQAVKQTLRAAHEVVTIEDGEVTVSYIADHRARIAAVQRVQHWQEMSRPKNQDNNNNLPTYEELLIIRRRYFENQG
jgi:hypothetical protein